MHGSDHFTGAPRPPLTYRITARQWLSVDVMASVLAMLIVAFGLRVGHAPRLVVLDAGVVAGIAATLPAAVRRLWPLPVLAVVTSGVAVLTALGRAPLTSDVMLGMAVYTAAARLQKTAAVVTLVATEAAILAGLLAAGPTGHAQSGALNSALAVAALWFVGVSVRDRRKYQSGLAEQDAQRQRTETTRARHVLQGERLRIARELHDVLAHTLSVVTVQAGVGRRVGAARPDEALRALRSVEEASRGALDELRHLLGLLRSDDETGDAGTLAAGDDAAGLAPAPGLADLDSLATKIRDAGTPVRVVVTGSAAALPPLAALTAYRIVQEALTNVVRHAPGAEAAVHVDISQAGLRIQVTNTGRTAGSPDLHGRGEGHGVVGMRERAATFGGTVDAAPLPQGGFKVMAFLPVTASTAERVA